MKKEKGKFIVVEGLDGSGKTEVINRIKADFPKFLYTREPGGSIFGEMIRSVLLDKNSKNVPPLPMLFGFMASRASHVQEKILPALAKGQNVISDRFDTSTFAFQLFGQENRNLEKTFWFNRDQILKNLKVEYIYLRIKPEVSMERRKNRELNNHFDNQTKSYHQRVFDGYEKFFSKTKARVHKVDASKSKDEVYQDVLVVIQKILNKK